MPTRYSARPWHLVIPSFMFIIGTVAPLFEGWIWFGVCMFLMGIGCTAWIILSGIWEAHANYWEKISRFAEIMLKNRNPHLWSALGFKAPDPEFKVELKTSPDNTAFGKTEYFDLPGSLLQFSEFCDGVLMGRPMSEDVWAGSGKTYSAPVFRSLKKELEAKKYIRLRVLGKPTQGYVDTMKGRKLFLKYASPQVRDKLQEQTNLVAPPDLELSPLLPE